MTDHDILFLIALLSKLDRTCALRALEAQITLIIILRFLLG
jgi:hypothetical protein